MSKRNSALNSPLIFSVASGKGGVGKSMVSCNLAAIYAKEGLSVTLLDLDFGAFNLHTLLGIKKPLKGWKEYFEKKVASLKDYVCSTSVPNLSLIQGSGLCPDISQFSYLEKLKLIQQIKELDCDIIILDLGAGSSDNVIDFFSITDLRVIVTTPEPTSMINSFEFLKKSIYRVFERMFADDPIIMGVLESYYNTANNVDTIKKLLEAIRKKDIWSYENANEVLESLGVYLVINQVKKMSDAQMGIKLKKACKNHLSLNLSVPGFIFYSEEVAASIMKMSPIVKDHPNSISSKILKRIALELLTQFATQLGLPSHNEIVDSALAKALSFVKSDYKQNKIMQSRIATRAI